MSDGLSPCARREAGHPCQLQCDLCEHAIEPMPEHLKEMMRSKLTLQLHCISAMFEHVQFNRDQMVFRDMLVNTLAAMRDTILTFDEEREKARKEQE